VSGKKISKIFFSLVSAFAGEKSCTVPFKTAPCSFFFFFFEEKEKRFGVTQKWVMTVAPLFTMLTEQRLCVVSL